MKKTTFLIAAFFAIVTAGYAQDATPVKVQTDVKNTVAQVEKTPLELNLEEQARTAESQKAEMNKMNDQVKSASRKASDSNRKVNREESRLKKAKDELYKKEGLLPGIQLNIETQLKNTALTEKERIKLQKSVTKAESEVEGLKQQIANSTKLIPDYQNQADADHKAYILEKQNKDKLASDQKAAMKVLKKKEKQLTKATAK